MPPTLSHAVGGPYPALGHFHIYAVLLQITVHTSNVRAAGPQGGLGVSIVLAGNKGSLPRSQLKQAGAFGRSQQDTFQVVGPGTQAVSILL